MTKWSRDPKSCIYYIFREFFVKIHQFSLQDSIQTLSEKHFFELRWDPKTDITTKISKLIFNNHYTFSILQCVCYKVKLVKYCCQESQYFCHLFPQWIIMMNVLKKCNLSCLIQSETCCVLQHISQYLLIKHVYILYLVCDQKLINLGRKLAVPKLMSVLYLFLITCKMLRLFP